MWRTMKLSSRWWPIGVALVGCAYSLKQFDWRNVGRVLATLPYVPLLAEISLATLAVFAVCSLRWIAVSGLPWRLSVIRDVHP